MLPYDHKLLFVSNPYKVGMNMYLTLVLMLNYSLKTNHWKAHFHGLCLWSKRSSRAKGSISYKMKTQDIWEFMDWPPTKLIYGTVNNTKLLQEIDPEFCISWVLHFKRFQKEQRSASQAIPLPSTPYPPPKRILLQPSTLLFCTPMLSVHAQNVAF